MTSETGWLIERTANGAPAWWCGWDTGGFSADPNEAIRFCREVDATKAAQVLDGSHGCWLVGGPFGVMFADEPPRITEHAWPTTEPEPELLASGKRKWGGIVPLAMLLALATTITGCATAHPPEDQCARWVTRDGKVVFVLVPCSAPIPAATPATTTTTVSGG